jgi:Zn-finger nucleic acid-binding protein
MQSKLKAGMLCPVCRVDLHMADRQGIEVDYCPRCRGVWLDRGELDKIMERSMQYEAPLQPAAGPQYRLPEQAVEHGYANADMRPDDNSRYPQRRDRHDDDRRRHRGRRGWLGDLLDFD